MTRKTPHSITLPAPAHAGRRRFLGLSALAGAGSALGLGSLANLLALRPAHAADYKALVCVFLYGGNDGSNTIVPTDATRHAQYAAVRRNLALPQGALLPLAGSDYGLHPALAALVPRWDAGHLAPVFNVGPLYRPMSKTEFRSAPASSPLIPDNLYSHSDQQLLWESSQTKSAERTGWGGRTAEAMGTAMPVISLGGTPRYGIGAVQMPLVLPGPGQDFGAQTIRPDDVRDWPMLGPRKAAIDALYAAGQESDLAEAFAAQQRGAFTVSEQLGGLIAHTPDTTGSDHAAIDTAFAGLWASGTGFVSPIAAQLYQAAKLIASNATVEGSRQLYFAQLDGFDTHGNQVGGTVLEGDHFDLLRQLGDALAAFQNALDALGLAQQVTTFTQSDFGRTLLPNNSSGTDHGWGNHHLVLGGAVHGRATYGRYPELALGGPDDVGVDEWERQGRWIPTTSVDQYAATLLTWFGATPGQLATALPNLANYSGQALPAFL
jgi:uncharacterized protein (DUF1501 family)